jgi:hypothetical protein
MGKRISKVRLILSFPLSHPTGFVYVARLPSAPLIRDPRPLISASAPAGRIPAGNGVFDASRFCFVLL